jgi:hypothetical protein
MSTFPDLIDLNDYVGRTRFLIDENSEKNFSTAQITLSINKAARDTQDEMLSAAPEAGWFEKPAELNATGTPPGTVATVQEYTLPSDFKRFKRVAHADTDIPLDPINYNERFIDTYSPNNAFIGMNPALNVGPQFYYITGNVMGLVPIPQGAYRIAMQYVYIPPLLQFGNDVSVIPIEYRDLMCVSAAIDCIVKDEGVPANLETMYGRELDRLRRTIGDRQIQLPQQVTRTGRSW